MNILYSKKKHTETNLEALRTEKRAQKCTILKEHRSLLLPIPFPIRLGRGGVGFSSYAQEKVPSKGCRVVYKEEPRSVSRMEWKSTISNNLRRVFEDAGSCWGWGEWSKPGRRQKVDTKRRWCWWWLKGTFTLSALASHGRCAALGF